MNAKKKKHIKKVVNIIFSVLTVVVLALAVYLFAGRSDNRVTFLFNRAFVWILSPSMEETIPENSYILIKKINAEEVKVGDIITFYSDDPALSGALNTHRVVEVIGDHTEFVTKGDNNLLNDKYTAKAKKVVGVYVKNLPGLTAVMRFFLTKAGFICLMSGFIVLTVAVYITEMKIKKKEEKQEELTRLMEAEIEKLKQDDLNK